MALAIILGLFGPIIEIGKCLAPPIKRQFTYLCCFNSNVQSLGTEAQNLENKKKKLLMEIDAPENNGLSIVQVVQTWIDDANSKIEGAGEISDLKIGCWDIKSRYQLSRKAVKIAGEMKHLVEDLNKFDRKCRPASPAARVRTPLSYLEFQSRKQIEEEIVKALEANETRIVGICGMGGVGKTTMAKRIKNRVKDTFKEIPMAVVSQQPDMFKIQEEIAESLDLKLEKNTLAARANELRTRLTGSNTKRILVVLDDIWETLKLNDLGIPCENEWCTILLTSRNMQVLNKMDVQKICTMQILSKEDAWSLFREKAGTCVDNENLHSVAERVAEECKGLPIALVTVGGALKNKTIPTFWEHALGQLKSFNPIDMPDVIKDVYNPLKLSYKCLEGRPAKSLFLLCSLFPEDSNISLEVLVSYCTGLRIFCNEEYSQVGKRVFALIDMLKNCFLLLEGSDEHHVRMHDVVRDVAIYIAKNEAKEGEVDVKFNLLPPSREFTFEWVSVCSDQKSNLLRMHARKKGFEIMDSSLFKDMEELNVLSFENILLKSLPMATQLLNNLRTLRLVSCNLMEPLSLSVVGELLSLEILCCHYCDIVELPIEIGKLIQLKLLDFSYCRKLKRIPPGVISNLEELEEFKMLGSFRGWESAAAVQGQERRNASLNEFEKLSKLTSLEIQIKDPNLLAEEICFPPNIVNYYIECDEFGGFIHGRPRKSKCMYLRLWRKIKLGSWVLRFLRSSNHLQLNGDVPFCLDLPQARSMKSLTLSENRSTDKRLVNPTTSVDDLSKFDVFRILENLSLFSIPNLEEIFDVEVLDSSNSFKNLTSLQLRNMGALRHLCKRPDRSPVSLENLEWIYIEKCNKLLNLFSFTMDGQNDNASIDDLLCIQKVHYPKLNGLGLHGLDNLEVIWNVPIPEGSNSFKNIRELNLFYLPAMTHLWKSPSRNISLNNLSKIRVNNCHKLRSLFLSTMSMDFVLQLQRLEIESCETMEQIMLLNEENENDTNQFREFPKLSMLTLHSLESLTTFSKGIKSIKFPKLIKMSIKSCTKLTSFLPSTGNNLYSAEGHDNHTFHLFCSEKVHYPKLNHLELHRLDKLEVIWNVPIPEGSNSFINIRELKLSYLPAMTHLWKSPSPNISLNNLSEVCVNNCHKLRSLFLSTMSMDFVLQLQRLEIESCETMEQIMLLNEKNENDTDQFREFPKLSMLKLHSLESLTTFSKGIKSIEFPKLINMSIKSCTKLTSFLPSTGNSVYSTEGHDNNTLHLFCSEKVSFGSLKEICIGMNADKSNMWCRQISPAFFNQLEKLEIIDCNGIKSLFSFSIAKNLFNLNILSIKDCNEMVKVIDDNEEMMCGRSLTLFPNLKKLQFCCIPKLESFGNWRGDPQLSSLQEVHIEECPLLEFFTMESVSFDNLKNICIGKDDKSNMWCRQIPLGFFNQLEKLKITDCNNIKSLFSTPVAEDLVNLRELTISECNGMVKVVEDNEEMLYGKSLRLFSSLKKLEFWFLDKLESFCNWKCNLHLPSLEYVFIFECPSLEFFSMGSVSTPNLKSIFFGRNDKICGDLNSEIQSHFKAKHQPSSTEKDQESTSTEQSTVEANQEESEIEEEDDK